MARQVVLEIELTVHAQDPQEWAERGLLSRVVRNHDVSATSSIN